VRVHLTEDAVKQFQEIQNHDNTTLSQGSLKYLQKLVELPAKHWLEIRRSWDNGVFKIMDVVPFDVRGKVEYGHAEPEITVFITHFRLKVFSPSSRNETRELVHGLN
jgi:hypothetical protein